YNICGRVRLTGILDVAALEESFREIVNRHEILRTSFVHADHQPTQVVRGCNVGLERVDFSLLSELDRQERVREAVERETEEGFDLEQGPLVRVRLLKVEEQEHVLLVTMHHIVSDGWSLGVMVRELGVLYEAYSQGGSSRLGELPIQYVDYAVWQQKWLAGGVLEKKLGYWREQLRGLEPLEMLGV